MVKRFSSLLLIFAMVLSMSACGKDSGKSAVTNTNTANTANTASASASTTSDVKQFSKTIEFSWIGLNGVEVEDGNIVQKAIEEKFNVKITNKKGNVTEKDQMNLMIAAGEMPDFAYLTPGINPPVDMYNQGVIRTIPQNLIKEYMPNYSKMLDDNPPGWQINLAQDKKDEYMCFTGLANNIKGLVFLPQYRLDWLEKIGMKPKGNLTQLDDKGKIFLSDKGFTMEEMEKIFIAFKEKDLDGNGKNDTFPMTGCEYKTWTWGTIMGMFGIAEDYNVNVNGEVEEWNISTQYKEFLKLAAKWYSMDLIDKEFTTLDRAKMWEKIAGGNVGWWIAPYSYLATTGSVPPGNLIEKNPDAKILVTAPEIGSNNISGSKQYTPVSTYSYAIYAKKNVDDEKLIRYMQIFDWLNYDTEARVLGNWGQEKVHFEWSGKPYESAPIAIEGVNTSKAGLRYYNQVIYDNDFLKFLLSPLQQNYAKWGLYGEGAKQVIRPFRFDYFNVTDISTVKKEVGQAIDTIRDEFYFKAVSGSVDIDKSWDNYVNEWKKAGGDRVLEELKKAPLVEELIKGNIKY